MTQTEIDGKRPAITKSVNDQIQTLVGLGLMNAEDVSDGYHTFKELYDHRVRLYITLCKLLAPVLKAPVVWHSQVHSDGTEWPGWFLLGISVTPGNQITYHLPMEYWDEVHEFSTFKERAPEFDGHTPADVIERLKTIK